MRLAPNLTIAKAKYNGMWQREYDRYMAKEKCRWIEGDPRRPSGEKGE